MTASGPRLITVGRIGAVHGVRGWLRLQSFTSPPEQIFAYQPWYLQLPDGSVEADIAEQTGQGDRLLIRLAGIDDRDAARRYTNVEIAVDAAVLPELESGEYYWHQLEGLRVLSCWAGEQRDLGRVRRLLETGANDVLVVRGDKDSIDKRERLIPWLPEHTIRRVDLARGEIEADWDPEF